jgi:transposase
MMDKTDVSEPTEEQYAALIGIDWADEKHDVWVYEVDTGKQSHRVIKHTPEALIEWVAELRTAFQGRPVAIGLEQFKGALISALLGYEFITLYPINPATLAKYREAFSPSRAKDDPSDAELLMELLLKHRDKLKAWKPDDEETRTLGMLNEERRKSVDWRTKLVQRLHALLKGYFPQAIGLLASNLSSDMACDFLQKWPTLDALKRAKPETVRAFYYGHNYRRGDLIEENLEKIRTAVALTEDKAIVTASTITAKVIAKQIRLINAAIEQYDKEIKALYHKHPDAFIFKSLPGSGKSMGPRLLTAFGTDRERFDESIDIQTYSGIAPVTERSGKHEWVHWRWGCPTFTRQSFHEFAGCSRKFSLWAKAYYELQRERGKKHHAAIRALAFKWQRVIFRCWKDRKPYDEERYIQALKANGSPLWPRIQALQNV